MNKTKLVRLATYRAACGSACLTEHMEEMRAEQTRVVEVGEGSMISIRNIAGLRRHTLPIMLEAEDPKNTHDRNIFFVDTFGLKSNEANFMYNATVLSAIWEDPTINESFNGVGRLAPTLYVEWLASGYIRMFGLDYSESDAVKVVTALYYHLQGTTITEASIEGDNILALIRKVGDATSVQDRRVRDIIDTNDIFGDEVECNFEWYMAALRKVSKMLDHRLNNVSALAIVSNSWYRGMTSPPQLALNYRPFFIAMLYTAMVDSSAARTGIDNMIKNALGGNRRQNAEVFVSSIEGIMKEQLAK